ncbi:hypothetical protein [Streptomyces xanthophaeus]|uniref:hypothetical protein n=1 Tax=Streptomyces xanthophaeus TaxID=67385 RepID=UPI003652E22E
MSQMKCRYGETLEKCCDRGCGRCTAGYVCPRHGKNWAYTTGGGLFTAGRAGSGAKCRKDGKAVVNCPACRGQSGKTCSACGGSGQTCPTHGRYWN